MNNITNLQNKFTNKQNIGLLWDVLLDELHINKTNKTLVENIKTIFESNINPFTSRINPKSNIMELNKLFLSQVVLAVNKLFPNLQKQDQNIRRITISDEEVIEPYKIEDIHASRQNEFEKQVERKRMEMENYMTPQKPRDLDFSDKNLDGKIKAMDSLVADKMAQRNMEIEYFQNNTNNNNNINIDPEKWLTPRETSVKNEKQPHEQKSNTKTNGNKLKHISIDNYNNVTLTPTVDTKNITKKVTWEDFNENEQTSNIYTNLFSKLKKQELPEMDETINLNLNLNNEEPIKQTTSYAEQQSIQLPEVKQEIINRNIKTEQLQSLPTPTPIVTNDTILPKSEMVKQLNEMNKKIDNLYEMVFKLTQLLQEKKDT